MIAVLKRMARGEDIPNEEAHEVLEGLDSVIIGDPDHCIEKARRYADIGADRLMCLLQFGRLPHEAVMRSTELAGQYLLPRFAKAGTPNS
ncbi:MAG: hypothetical protein WDN03_07885 [Rhizomicrobium sp.]